MASNVKNLPIVILGRWQPVHLGHRAALHALCSQFDQVLVGIGSSNIHDYRNPFTLSEVTEMLHLTLASYTNYALVPIEDTPDDEAWCRNAIALFGKPEYFVTDNPYVASLLSDKFPLAHPAQFIPEEQKILVSGTVVRRELARGNRWAVLVPDEIAEFIITRQLDISFRERFGLQTLTMETIVV
jgi:nicotinamide-nucleotide adenylyltransferase